MNSDLPKGKPILCIDFDGVIHSYISGWQGATNIPDAPVEGAMRFLKEALYYFDVCIYSSRSRYWGGRKAMKRWLFQQLALYFDESQFENDRIHDSMFTSQTMSVLMRLKFPLTKPAAFLLIDDRALRFEGTFYDPKILLSFKPWNKGGT